MSSPRENAEDAYQAFLNMPATEWALLIRDLCNGGVLTPAEQAGFDRALEDRQRAELRATLTALGHEVPEALA
jgi:hypothetical protein